MYCRIGEVGKEEAEGKIRNEEIEARGHKRKEEKKILLPYHLESSRLLITSRRPFRIPINIERSQELIARAILPGYPP